MALGDDDWLDLGDDSVPLFGPRGRGGDEEGGERDADDVPFLGIG